MDFIEISKSILQEKIDALETVGNITMLWWVSVVVFCGTLLGGTIAKIKDIKEKMSRKLRISLSFIVLIFFLSVVGFGFLVINYANRCHQDVIYLLETLQLPKNTFATEFHLLKWGTIFGTSSFVLVLIAWIFISFSLISKSN